MNVLTAPRTETALATARRTYADGLKCPAPRIPNMERRQSARYVADLSRRVSAAEMEALADATQLREEALSLSRKGVTSDARHLLDEAAALVEARTETREARISAASFHGAAAGFVEHVDGQHNAAMDEMLDALRHCQTLRQEFGHSVALRSIHLARNVARLVWSLGRHSDASALCAALIAHTWYEQTAWPLESGTGLSPEATGSLRRDERVFLTDQLVSESVSTCADARAQDIQFSLPTAADYSDLGDGFPERALAAQQVCASCLGGDLDTLVQTAATYFEGGPGDMPMTWRRILRLVEDETGEPLAAD